MKFDIERVRQLRAKGLTYKAISLQMGMGFSTVKEYLNPQSRAKKKIRDKRNNNLRLEKCKQAIINIKKERGGACEICGYNRCLQALHFHHKQNDKLDNVSNLKHIERIRTEALKCELLCANCHTEKHYL